MHKGRPNVQVAHITMPAELRERLEKSSEGAYALMWPLLQKSLTEQKPTA